jgi:hypothetical protein
MTIRISWLPLFAILFLHCRQHTRPISLQLKNGNSYECVLAVPDTNNLHCGILEVAVAMKFHLGAGDSVLAIVIPCPELYGNNFFLKDQAYRVTLTADSSVCKNCTVINHYEKLKLPTYYAINIEKINQPDQSGLNARTTGKIITIIGNAENEKAGAAVISKDDGKRYHVDGLASWDEKIVGKPVKVTGKLLVENYEPPKPDEEERQQIIGIKRIILEPAWELIPN